jgi:alpha-beta hydrolase superfamily lysophospholipase
MRYLACAFIGFGYTMRYLACAFIGFGYTMRYLACAFIGFGYAMTIGCVTVHSTALRQFARSKFEEDLIKQGAHQSEYIDVHPSAINPWKMYTQLWTPESGISAAKALLIVSHGVNDQSGRFARAVPLFTDKGIAVAAFDHYGHGRSEGLHGFVPSVECFRNAISTALQHFIKIIPQGMPVYLYGESMGGLAVVDSLLHLSTVRQTIKGAVFLNPAIQVHADSVPPAAAVSVLKFLSKLMPRCAMVPQTIKGRIHPDPKVEADIFATPGSYNGWMRLKTGTVILDVSAGIQQQPVPSELPPVYVVVGEQDRCTDPVASRRFFEKWQKSCRQLQFESIANGYHYLTVTEQDLINVFNPIINWILYQSK